MRKKVWQETMRLLKEIDDSVKDILREAEEELRSLSPQQRFELFGTDDVPFFDDPIWEELFPIGSDEEEEEF
jgi:hypothetical protein